jgi:hypothetical protein
MKTHFLPSEQRGRVTRFRASLRVLGILLVCACLAHVASALYVIENPAQIAVPQASGNGAAPHDITLISPGWIISSSNDGPKATASAENWQSPATFVRDAQLSTVHVYLYRVESPDPARGGTLQYPESGQELTIQGRPNVQLRLTLNQDGTGSVDQDVSGFVGRPLNPLGDSSVLGMVAVDESGKATVVTTSQLIKSFPELAH